MGCELSAIPNSALQPLTTLSLNHIYEITYHFPIPEASANLSCLFCDHRFQVPLYLAPYSREILMYISDTTQAFGHAVSRGESMSISAHISFFYESERVYTIPC